MSWNLSVWQWVKLSCAAAVGVLLVKLRLKDRKIQELTVDNLKCHQGAESEASQKKVDDAKDQVSKTRAKLDEAILRHRANSLRKPKS